MRSYVWRLRRALTVPAKRAIIHINHVFERGAVRYLTTPPDRMRSVKQAKMYGLQDYEMQYELCLLENVA